MSPPFNIAVLISGGGTTLKNLIEVQQAGKLNAEFCQVISSNSSAAGNSIASQNNIPLSVVPRNRFDSDAAFSTQIFQICRQASANLVVMGGFLKKLLIPDDFTNRVINIHPSLIPAFCGKGFYGIKVHRAVIEYGCKVSGCTVHFVDNEYDHGPVIAQQAAQIAPDESPETLQQRIFQLECCLYPEVINQIVAGQIRMKNRIVSVRSPAH